MAVDLRSLEVGVVTLGRILAHGFFILRAQDTKVVRAIMLLTPWRSRYGMCIFQKWVTGYENPYIDHAM
jgi:hypothetical protein